MDWRPIGKKSLQRLAGVKNFGIESQALLNAVLIGRRRSGKQRKFDRSSKSVLEFKASLIAAGKTKRRWRELLRVVGIFNKTQPISVGV